MERRGNLVYLSTYEQRVTGYSSPINLDDFDLHAERLAADTELDRLTEEEVHAIDDAYQTGHYNSAYERALSRSQLTRNIGKSMASDTLVVEGITQIEEFLENPNS